MAWLIFLHGFVQKSHILKILECKCSTIAVTARNKTKALYIYFSISFFEIKVNDADHDAKKTFKSSPVLYHHNHHKNKQTNKTNNQSTFIFLDVSLAELVFLHSSLNISIIVSDNCYQNNLLNAKCFLYTFAFLNSLWLFYHDMSFSFYFSQRMNI